MLGTKSSFKSPQTRFNLLLLEDGEFFLDVRCSMSLPPLAAGSMGITLSSTNADTCCILCTRRISACTASWTLYQMRPGMLLLP